MRIFHSRRSAARGGFSTRAGQRSFRPRFEALESRNLLSATVINVDTFDDVVDAGDGVTSLREAVIAANASAGDEEIQLVAGTYALTVPGNNDDIAATGDLDVLNNGSLKVVGAGAGMTTIDANALNPSPGIRSNDGGRVFDIHGAVLQLESMMLTGGNEHSGGAIRNSGGLLTIESSKIADSYAIFGAGIYNVSGGLVTIIDTTISDNLGAGGVGLYNEVNSQMTIVGSLITNNSSPSGLGAGGGILNYGVLTISASTVSNNRVGIEGGGIYNAFGRLTITDCTISGNIAEDHFRTGGGIFAAGQMTISGSLVTGNIRGGISITGNATIVDTVVSNNNVSGITNSGNVTIIRSSILNNVPGSFADSRGMTNSGIATIADSTFFGNVSWSDGGAIRNSDGEVTINRTTLSNNSAVRGGAIYNASGGTVALSNSTLSGNSAQNGGGVYNTSGPVTITSSTLSGNSTSRDGGGIYVTGSGSQVTIRHTTITGNRAGTDGNASRRGGGLFIPAGTVTLDHALVAGNVRGVAPGGTPSDIENGSVDPASAYNLLGDPLTAGGLVHGTNGNIVGDGGGNLLPIGLILNPTLADNGGPTLTHALVAGSAAVNAGDPLFDPDATIPPVSFDQRGAGFDRVFDGRIDIGAFEFGSEFQNVVVGRHIFYNNSKFDGNVPGINAADNDAIAPDKHALVAGLAGFANITNYSRGINGIMIDIAGSHPDITVDDFTFRVGDNDSFAFWALAPQPAAISVLAGQGVGGADRIEIVWADGHIKNTYLQVIVAANERTGLAAADAFFWGNRVGDSGTSTPATYFQTTSTDAVQVFAKITGSAAIGNVRDYDRSGDVTASDAAIVFANLGALARIEIMVPAAALKIPLVRGIVPDVAAHNDALATEPRIQGPLTDVGLVPGKPPSDLLHGSLLDHGKAARASARRTTAQRWIDVSGREGRESVADEPL